MKKIFEHFRDNDPVIYKNLLNIQSVVLIQKEKQENYFIRLCEIIVGQQLSNKAADAIFLKFKNIFKGKSIMPSDILTASHEKLRSSGISNAKAVFMKNLASAVLDGRINIQEIDMKSDDGVILELTKIKGIGPWTAEMFLMFVLGRQDVFSSGDLGLRKAIKKLYNLKKEPTKRQIEKIVAKWSPYKTFASRILWATLDTK